MALTDEQRSMLQLLLGGQSYEDIASLLGTGADDVRARARGALRELGGADPDAQVALSDYLLGQADPIGRADAVRHLQADPEANALAARLIPQLRLLAPAAELPEIPVPKGGRPAAAPPPPAPPSGAPTPPTPPAGTPGPAAPGRASRAGGALAGIASSERRSQLLVGLGAVALLLVVGALAIAGVFSGGDGDGDGGDDAAATPTDENLTIVQLAPLDGGAGGTGQAVFAQTQNQPVLQINLSGLQPAGEGQTYIVWLYNSDQIAFPIARDQVGENGNLTGAAAIPQQITSLVGNQFGCVDVSLASTKQTQKALRQAVQGGNLPAHSGESVLRGQIPTQPGEEAPSGADSQCGGTAPAQGSGGQ